MFSHSTRNAFTDLQLNPMVVVAGRAIIIKTRSDTQARLEHDNDELRPKALQKEILSAKLKPEDGRRWATPTISDPDGERASS